MSNTTNNVVALRDGSTAAIEGEIVTAGTVTLGEIEATIEDRFTSASRAFVEIGTLFARIRDERLWEADHPTFSDYLRARWDHIGYTRASQFIVASRAARELEQHTSIRLPNEGVARAVVAIGDTYGYDKAAKVVEAAAAAGKITAQAVTDTATAAGYAPKKRKQVEPTVQMDRMIAGVLSRGEKINDLIEAHNAANGGYNATPFQRSAAKAAAKYLREIAGKLDAAVKTPPKPTVEPTPEPAAEAVVEAAEATPEVKRRGLRRPPVDPAVAAARAAELQREREEREAAEAAAEAARLAALPEGWLRDGDHPVIARRSGVPNPIHETGWKVVAGYLDTRGVLGRLSNYSWEAHHLADSMPEAQAWMRESAGAEIEGSDRPDGGKYTEDDWRVMIHNYGAARVWIAFADSDAADRYDAWLESLAGMSLVDGYGDVFDVHGLAARLVGGVPAGTGVLIADTEDGRELARVIDPAWTVALIMASKRLNG